VDENRSTEEREHGDAAVEATRKKEDVYLTAHTVSEPVRLEYCACLGKADLYSESTLDIRQTLRQHRHQFVHARTDLSDLSVSYPRLTAPIVEAIDRASLASIAGSRDTVLSDTEFSFDQELISTRLYRDNMARLMDWERRGKKNDDVGTGSLSSDTSGEPVEDPPTLKSPSGPKSGRAATLKVDHLRYPRLSKKFAKENVPGLTSECLLEHTRQNSRDTWRTAPDRKERASKRYSTRENTEDKQNPSSSSGGICSNDGVTGTEESKPPPIDCQNTTEVKQTRKSTTRRHHRPRRSYNDSLLVNLSSPSVKKPSLSSSTSILSIKNPELLKTLEDAIRRLILPEIEAAKREQSTSKESAKTRVNPFSQATTDNCPKSLESEVPPLPALPSEPQESEFARASSISVAEIPPLPALQSEPQGPVLTRASIWSPDDIPPLPYFQSDLLGSEVTRDSILSAKTDTAEHSDQAKTSKMSYSIPDDGPSVTINTRPKSKSRSKS